MAFPDIRKYLDIIQNKKILEIICLVRARNSLLEDEVTKKSKSSTTYLLIPKMWYVHRGEHYLEIKKMKY